MTTTKETLTVSSISSNNESSITYLTTESIFNETSSENQTIDSSTIETTQNMTTDIDINETSAVESTTIHTISTTYSIEIQNVTDEVSSVSSTISEIPTTLGSGTDSETKSSLSTTVLNETESTKTEKVSTDHPSTLITSTEIPIKMERQYQNLTLKELGNIITVVFLASNTELYSNWNTTYEEIFQSHLLSFLDSYLAEMENNKTIKEDVVLKTRGLEHFKTSRSIVYISPYPSVKAEQLFISFFIQDNLKNETERIISSNITIEVIKRYKSELQNELGLNITDIFQGMKTHIDPVTKPQKSFLEQYSVLLITFSVLIGLAVVIGIIVFVYLCNRNSEEYITDKIKLKDDMRNCIEIGDMANSREILSDEMGEKEVSGLVNGSGNHIIKMDEDVWVVPFSDIPLEERNPPDMQDTRL
ncbi:uncharacterized protein [Centruroides vittatus]|uniref:uncharacterized protein isoform X2 n=1 Tax=Centruroides vittatus TaxID=120091 RepID=UPI00350EA5BD